MAHDVVRTLTLLLGGVTVAAALFLLVVGAPFTGMDEQGVPHTGYRPTMAAVFPLVGAVLILSGVAWNRYLVAWIGLNVLLVFSVLFLFGIGGWFLLGGIAFLVLLILQQLRRNQSPNVAMPRA